MPNGIVIELIKKVAKLEARVENLVSYQKWQMGLLAAIFMAILGTWIAR